MTQLAATAEAVVGVNMQPHGVRCVARLPALRTKLQCASLLDGDPLGRCLQVGFGDVQGVGQSASGLLLEYRGVATLDLADALGMNAGLLGHGLLTHAEG